MRSGERRAARGARRGHAASLRDASRPRSTFRRADAVAGTRRDFAALCWARSDRSRMKSTRSFRYFLNYCYKRRILVPGLTRKCERVAEMSMKWAMYTDEGREISRREMKRRRKKKRKTTTTNAVQSESRVIVSATTLLRGNAAERGWAVKTRVMVGKRPLEDDRVEHPSDGGASRLGMLTTKGVCAGVLQIGRAHV